MLHVLAYLVRIIISFFSFLLFLFFLFTLAIDILSKTSLKHHIGALDRHFLNKVICLFKNLNLSFLFYSAILHIYKVHRLAIDVLRVILMIGSWYCLHSACIGISATVDILVLIFVILMSSRFLMFLGLLNFLLLILCFSETSSIRVVISDMIWYFFNFI